MCRYAVKIYKSHYVCFKCRKSFKQPDIDDILRRIKKEKIYHESDGKSIRKVGPVFTKTKTEELKELVSEIGSRSIRCPECRNIMADLGKDFKAPKKTAVKEWKIVESLFKIGKCFHSCGCDGIGYIPKNTNDYAIYLKTILQTYEEYLISYQNVSIIECHDKNERINYWSENIQKVKTEIIDNKFDTV